MNPISFRSYQQNTCCTFSVSAEFRRFVSLPDGKYHITMLGNGEKSGDRFYCMTGKVYQFADQDMVNAYEPYGKCESCSRWTDKQRDAAIRKIEREKERRERERIAAKKKHEALVASARKKLTEDEFSAVLAEGAY